MDASRRHRADCEAEANCESFEFWNDRADWLLRREHIDPTAYSRDERFAAWADDITPEDAVDSFADAFYDSPTDGVGPGDCDVPHDHADNPSRFRDDYYAD
jgi:hypothetical protein